MHYYAAKYDELKIFAKSSGWIIVDSIVKDGAKSGFNDIWLTPSGTIISVKYRKTDGMIKESSQRIAIAQY
jgi:hypothetical protein